MTEELKDSQEEEKKTSSSEQAPSDDKKQESEGSPDELREKIKKLEEERDNYKKGLLDSKEKLKYALSEEEEKEENGSGDLRDVVKEVVSEQIKGLTKENEELKTALKSKRSMTMDHIGANKDKGEEKPKAKLSEGDREFLRSRGEDPDEWAEKHPEIGRHEQPGIAQ